MRAWDSPLAPGLGRCSGALGRPLPGALDGAAGGSPLSRQHGPGGSVIRRFNPNPPRGEARRLRGSDPLRDGGSLPRVLTCPPPCGGCWPPRTPSWTPSPPASMGHVSHPPAPIARASGRPERGLPLPAQAGNRALGGGDGSAREGVSWALALGGGIGAAAPVTVSLGHGTGWLDLGGCFQWDLLTPKCS